MPRSSPAAQDLFDIRTLPARGRIAGVDEAGRGPLAGPVVAAAVILPADFDLTDIADSKTLSAERRARAAARLATSAEIGLAIVPASVIDRINIHAATLLAMRRAVLALPGMPDEALLDGRFVPPALPCPARAVVKGDALVAAIGAASIIAKVTRDAIMREAERHFPGYGFAKDAGYPTPAHRAALARLGPSPLHRMSFGPLRRAF